MKSGSDEGERRAAWAAAKAAVRSYAHDPSELNAARVREAWGRVKRSEERPIPKGLHRSAAELEEV